MGMEEETKQRELFEAFRTDAVYGDALKKAVVERSRLAKIRLYYDTDDIFRREIDHLKAKMKKNKKHDVKAFEGKIDELLREAEYRRYIASFEHMKENYEARKKEMAKVKAAFS